MTEKNQPASRFEALFRRGTELLSSGAAAQSVPLLQEAHQLDPDHLDAAINLGGAYILTGRFKWAVPLLEALAGREPDNAMIWTNLGAAYLGNPVLATDENQRQAIAAFEHALEIDPAAPHVAYNIGLIHRDRQNNEQAVNWFRRAVQANPLDQDAVSLLKRLSQLKE